MVYNNIETFYKKNANILINGELRPVVSYNKDAEEYILKLKNIYENNGRPNSITIEQIEKGLGVTRGSNVATVESPLTWISLGLIEPSDNGDNKKDPNYKYFFTDDFITLADNNMIPGVHILNKLLSIESLDSISKFTNLLLCTLREGYLQGHIIDFPRENDKYSNAVTNTEQKIEYNKRISKIYGYKCSIDDSPHASMRAINNLVKLELISKTEPTSEKFTQYTITEYGHKLLSSIDYQLGNCNKSSSILEESIDLEQSDVHSLLAAMRTKPFLLLAGISGTGKSRIVRRLAQASITEELQKKYDKKSVENGFDRWKLHKPANFELIQVKPNWHNSMEVVGYKSNINGAHYEFTPFIEFVTRAWLHPTVPFFLCLDEMNLAPVEQYFAEFLSAIESRTKENGEYMTDPIIKPFTSFGEKLCDDMLNAILPTVSPSETGTPFAKRIEFLKGHFKEKGLTLPENLIVMGTVNMDETTFSFSRKVLDRAMSIVMNDVNLEDYFSNQSDVITSELSDDTISALINRPISGLEVIDDDSQKVREFFEAVNMILDGSPFKLGYRAISEALLYVHAAKVFGCESITDALDQFTMMKIISRIEGDKRSISDLLDELQKVITTDFKQSNEKLQSMARTLNASQFVSYWT